MSNATLPTHGAAHRRQKLALRCRFHSATLMRGRDLAGMKLEDEKKVSNLQHSPNPAVRIEAEGLSGENRKITIHCAQTVVGAVTV